MTRNTLILALSLTFLAGCASQQPIVTPESQARQEIYNKYLTPENNLKYYLRHINSESRTLDRERAKAAAAAAAAAGM